MRKAPTQPPAIICADSRLNIPTTTNAPNPRFGIFDLLCFTIDSSMRVSPTR